MQEKRRSGFTVIELVVVVAIIALLAVMVVPVFVQQREAARSKTCLSNQQKILAALRMYMADNDQTTPPDEHWPEAVAYFDTMPGGYFEPMPGGGEWILGPDGHCRMATLANPYLRWPVIFDPYLSDRNVWRCPSARLQRGAGWIVPGPDWLGAVKANQGGWPRSSDGTWIGGPCETAWPPGWGGIVTDSFKQNMIAVDNVAGIFRERAFIQSIAVNNIADTKLAAVEDPATFWICGDAGAQVENLTYGIAAYPDICCLECGNPVCATPGQDWEVSMSSDCCGPACPSLHAPGDGAFLTYPSLRVPYGRHRAFAVASVPFWLRSGVNITFLDGHSQWTPSETFLSMVARHEINGLRNQGPTSTCGFAELYPGVPTLY